MRTPALAPALLLALLSSTLRAQSAEASNAPGSWQPLHRMESVDPAVPLAARQAIAPALERMLAVLRATPTLGSPIGFEVLPTISAEPGPYWAKDADSPGYGRGPVQGIVSLILVPLVRDDATGRVHGSGEGPDLTLRTNDARCLYPGWSEPYAADSAGPIYVEPRRAADVHGHPAYLDRAGEPCVVVTRRTAPLYVPVSNERLLRALIAADRATLPGVQEPAGRFAEMLRNVEEMKRSGNAQMRAQAEEMERRIRAAMPRLDSATDAAGGMVRRRLASHERLLAAMTPEQRRAPAVVRDFAMADDPFSPPAEGQAFQPTAIVAPNPAFFDVALPIGEVQLITFHTACHTAGCSGWGNALRAKVLDELDWAALEAVAR